MVVGFFLTTIGQRGFQFPCHVFLCCLFVCTKGRTISTKEGRWWWQELAPSPLQPFSRVFDFSQTLKV